jgi:hypothetical protein
VYPSIIWSLYNILTKNPLVKPLEQSPVGGRPGAVELFTSGFVESLIRSWCDSPVVMA